MKAKTRWRVGFLSLTTLVVGMELWAAFDGNDDTEPWTELIVGYIPGEITVAAIGALCLWLPVHFGARYWRGRRDDRP